MNILIITKDKSDFYILRNLFEDENYQVYGYGMFIYNPDFDNIKSIILEKNSELIESMVGGPDIFLTDLFLSYREECNMDHTNLVSFEVAADLAEKYPDLKISFLTNMSDTIKNFNQLYPQADSSWKIFLKPHSLQGAYTKERLEELFLFFKPPNKF